MLTITTEQNGDTNIVKLAGRLDIKAAKDAEEAFTQAAESSKNVMLDFAELEYIASAGLRALKKLRTAIRSNGGSLKVCNVGDDVMEILEMTGFSAMLEII